jgi:hypothetical protein
MLNLSILPARQKILLGLTTVAGLGIIVCGLLEVVKPEVLKTTVFMYGIAVPLLLLMLDTIVDLNNVYIFRLWVIIGTIALIISLGTFGSENFRVQRSVQIDTSSDINSWIGNFSTSSLKALIIFLAVYRILNGFIKARKGVFIINTFKQSSWHHDIANRKITALDVIVNFVLFVTIIASSLFGF